MSDLLARAAAEHGTPCFVYDLDRVRAQTGIGTSNRYP